MLIPKEQRFWPHSKGDFHKLCGSGPVDRTLPVIVVTREDLITPLGKETLLNAARGRYKDWSTIDYPFQNPTLGDVLVNRVGWRHITRQGRLQERIFQSLGLIGVAKRMISEIEAVDMLGRATIKTSESGLNVITDHLGLRATIIFPHRHQSVVQIVLKRERKLSKEYSSPPEQKIWFLSIYELRRGV